MAGNDQVTLELIAAQHAVLRRRLGDLEGRMSRLEDEVSVALEKVHDGAASGATVRKLQKQVASLGQRLGVIGDATGAGRYDDQPVPKPR